MDDDYRAACGSGPAVRIEGDGEVEALYDRWAATYDTDENRTRDLAGEVLRSELGELVEADVVELGCGTGRNTGWLAERSGSVVAVDFSRSMLDEARRKISDARVRFLEHDIRSALPLGSGSADLVAIALVLEHVAAIEPVFGECARVLRSGGHLFVCELHPYRQWAGGQARFTVPGSSDSVRVPAFLHSVSEFVNAGIAAGLCVERLGEWRDERDEAESVPPRLLSLLYRRVSRVGDG